MGCLFSRFTSQGSPKSTEPEEPVQYSWDKREKVDPKDFTVENLKGETAGRIPGTVNGQQFIIQNCEDCYIYVFDHIATINIDDCVNCRIFLGPVKQSIFIRDCKNCTIVGACQQFRTRDCKGLQAVLCCVSQPIIEASTGVKFGCYRYSYPQLEDQFKNAGLSVYNNNWYNVHDFTPVPDETNFALMAQDYNIEEVLPLPTTEQFSDVQISLAGDASLVPYTYGPKKRLDDESCLVVFFNDGLSHDRAKNFINEMKEHHSGCNLIQSKEISMQDIEAERVFGSDSYSMAARQGPVIGLDYNGENSIRACQETLVAVSRGSTGLVFVSSSAGTAMQQIENFFNFADMQMNA